MTNKDQSREAFEAWLIQDRRSRNIALHEWTEEEIKGVFLCDSKREWEAWQAARSAPAAPVELPEPIGVVRVFEPHEGVGKICSEASTDITRLPIGRSLLYTEQQVRELLEKGGRQTAPDLPQTRTGTQLEVAAKVLPVGWVAVPVEPTNVMLGAAYPVRRNGGLNLDVWNAMLAAAPKLPAPEAPTPLSRHAVIQHLTSTGVIEQDGCGLFIAAGLASELIDACMGLAQEQGS